MILTPLILQNGDLLRQLAAGEHVAAESLAAFALKLGRDRSNFGKTLNVLAEAGLTAQPAAFASLAVTDAGKAAIAALDRAAGAGSAPIEAFRTNPFNPRPELDFLVEELDALGQTIAFEGLLKPLLVTQPYDDGLRVILDGERRSRGIRRAILAGDLRADFPVDFTEKFVPPELLASTTARLALIANGGKALPRIAEARALVVVMDAEKLNAAELARATGKHPRFVQEAVRVIRHADPAAIAAFEAGEDGWTWERLRDSVKEEGARAPGAGKTEAEAIAAGDDPFLWVNGVRHGNRSRAQEAQFAGGLDQRKANTGGGLKAVIADLPPAQAEEPPPALPMPEPPKRQVAGEAAELVPGAVVALVELLDAVRAVIGEGGTLVDRPVPVFKVHLCPFAPDLTRAGLAAFAPAGAGLGWFGRLTLDGVKWLAKHDYKDQAADAGLNRARYDLGELDWQGPGYITPWLNPPPAPEASAPADPEPVQADLDVEAKLAAAVDLLGQARALPAPAFGFDAVSCASAAAILAGGGHPLPWTPSPGDPGVLVDDAGDVVLALDSDRNLPDDLVEAIALVLAAGVNRFAAEAAQ
jgi:hypothetical protein